jgi:hypothetical protein
MAKSKVARGSGPSKMKMVEEAMRELGDSTPKAMQSYINQKYGVEIGTTMISSYKSNIRKRGGSSGRGGADASVGVRDVALIRNLIDRMGANQLQALIKVMSK